VHSEGSKPCIVPGYAKSNLYYCYNIDVCCTRRVALPASPGHRLHSTKRSHGAPKPPEFQRHQLTQLASTDFESWAKESFEIAAKFAYRNGERIGIPRGGNIDCTMVAAAPVLPAGYVVNASRIAARRMILAEYRLADLLTRVIRN
jgi:hypothetical protein